MLVVMQYGVSRGEVHDMPPHEARAMIADGRARWPEGSPFAAAPAVVSAPVVSARVDARDDRALPRHKRQGRR